MDGITPSRLDYRISTKTKDRECARNVAVREFALGSDPSYEWFVFLDHDVRPTGNTSQFLHLEADVKCCEVEMESKAAWCRRDASFHDAMWCTSRKVLESIKPPWFVQRYNEDHTQMDGCICQSFRDKVIEAGFSISHGGYAEHDRDGSWC